MKPIEIARAVTQACLHPSGGKLYGDRDRLIASIAEAIQAAYDEGLKTGANAMRRGCEEVLTEALSAGDPVTLDRCRSALAALDAVQLIPPRIDGLA